MNIAPEFVSADNYLRLPRDPDTWLLRSLLPASGSAVLYAPPKVGKTYLALQMASAIAGNADSWMEFDVVKKGPVAVIQLDTPRTLFAPRYIEAMSKNGGMSFRNVHILDNEILDTAVVDIRNPAHKQALRSALQKLNPALVIIDTLRKMHSGDENSSNDMSDVMAHIKSCCFPAAVLMISHERKPAPEGEKDIMNDFRGSTSVVGEMDVILRLAKSNRLYYAGRAIEPGSVKLRQLDVEDCLMWEPDPEDGKVALQQVLQDPRWTSDRARARELAKMTNKSLDACMSMLRRKQGRLK